MMSKEEKNQCYEAYPMTGGDEPHSYYHNSKYQGRGTDAAKGFIEKAIFASFDLKNPYFDFINNSITIADFGCSVGPNTFIAVQNIIEAVKHKFQMTNHQNIENVEFLVFFNDHINNDFNKLFKSFPLAREYYASGTPGSFHERMFPKRSLYIGHASYTIHWLSKVPTEVCDRKAKAWNKDSIYCSDLVKEVVEAYSTQFKHDIGDFLSVRSQEIVPGGLMLILGLSPPEGLPLARVFHGVVHDALGSCLFHMAKLGLVSKEKVESFNVPVHFARVTELVESIEQNGSFRIEKLEKFSHPMGRKPPSIEFMVYMYRSIYHGMIEEFFGNGVGDELFDNHHFEKILREYSSKFEECDEDMHFFMLLKRKDD